MTDRRRPALPWRRIAAALDAPGYGWWQWPLSARRVAVTTLPVVPPLIVFDPNR